MGLVSKAFARKRAQLHVVRVLKERKQTPQPVFIEKPIRSIGRFYTKLTPEAKREAVRMKYEGHRDRPWLEAQYYHFERVAKYANFS